MARGSMLTVFSYDISSNRNRRRAARLLEDVASRVQLSVFEAQMTKRQADHTIRHLLPFLDRGDSLRVYVVAANGLRRSQVHGDTVPFEPEGDFWLV